MILQLSVEFKVIYRLYTSCLRLRLQIVTGLSQHKLYVEDIIITSATNTSEVQGQQMVVTIWILYVVLFQFIRKSKSKKIFHPRYQKEMVK